MPCSERYAQTAALIATTCASVKLPSSDVPRCPDVPNATGADGGSLAVRGQQPFEVDEVAGLRQLSRARIHGANSTVGACRPTGSSSSPARR